MTKCTVSDPLVLLDGPNWQGVVVLSPLRRCPILPTLSALCWPTGRLCEAVQDSSPYAMLDLDAPLTPCP
jgi:hypothetical protein